MMNQPIVLTRGALTAVSDGEVVAVYNSDSLTVSSLDTPLKIRSTKDLEAVLPASPGLRVVNRGSSRPPTPTFVPLLDRSQRHSLSRFTINIANSCNLWCSYCYADHGTYHAPASLMSIEKAVQAAQRCLQLYPQIGTVQFFGGEPLLNSSAIDSVCMFFQHEAPGSLPEFVATTNGTVLNEEILAILLRHNVGLTISVDGPAAIHDYLRPAKNGASSHAAILQNVERLRSLGVRTDFECTYTLKHYELGISVSDLLDYFAEEFDETSPHISWAYLPQPTLAADPGQRSTGVFRNDIAIQAQQYLPVDLAANLFRAAARKSMQNIAMRKGAALTFVLGILKNLSTRAIAHAYCPAFNSQLSVAADGTVYPCFMFIGEDRKSVV